MFGTDSQNFSHDLLAEIQKEINTQKDFKVGM